jgi:hypothetical protein
MAEAEARTDAEKKFEGNSKFRKELIKTRCHYKRLEALDPEAFGPLHPQEGTPLKGDDVDTGSAVRG